MSSTNAQRILNKLHKLVAPIGRLYSDVIAAAEHALQPAPKLVRIRIPVRRPSRLRPRG